MRIADFEMGADDVTNVARRFEFGLEIRGGDKLINRSRRLAALPNQFVQSVHLLGAPAATGRVTRQSQKLTMSVTIRALRIRAID
ncbi:hypothetical protein BOC59_27540 [Burkholderia pseudomallei]|nr:hypothetical protein BOC59_27540 [Burkholderia pseudomallei]